MKKTLKKTSNFQWRSFKKFFSKWIANLPCGESKWNTAKWNQETNIVWKTVRVNFIFCICSKVNFRISRSNFKELLYFMFYVYTIFILRKGCSVLGNKYCLELKKLIYKLFLKKDHKQEWHCWKTEVVTETFIPFYLW